MVSTYTQNNGVEKPGIGEQSNTWGNTANTNYDILDRAANGVGTIALTGTSSNLSTLDGSVSDGQYKVLLLTGSLGATHTITILPNDVKKMYMVYNLTGQSVVFTQGSGGNVTILNGDSVMIYCTGIGATSAVVNIADHLAMSSPRITGGSISGLSAPLAVADGGTGGNTQAAARTGLGLGTMATLATGTAGGEFRTNSQNDSVFQFLDATLTAYANFSGAANLVPYFTAADTLASMTVTSAARTVLDDTTVGAMLTTLGGQPLNTNLTEIAAPTYVRGDLIRRSAAQLDSLSLGASGTVVRSNGTDVQYGSSIQRETAVAVNTLTVVNFTGIASHVERVTVSFRGVTTATTAPIFVRIGGSGGIETTGYSGAAVVIGNAVATAASVLSTAFWIEGGTLDTAAAIRNGVIILQKVSSSDAWAASGNIGYSTTGLVSIGGGITLPGPLTQLRIGINGTDTFDGGTVNVSYE